MRIYGVRNESGMRTWVDGVGALPTKTKLRVGCGALVSPFYRLGPREVLGSLKDFVWSMLMICVPVRILREVACEEAELPCVGLILGRDFRRNRGELGPFRSGL